MTADPDKCDCCGTRGRPMRGLDLLDGSDQFFRACVPCQDDALIVIGSVRLFTLGEES